MLNGGGSYAKFSAGGIELGTNGNFVAHAAKHSLLGAKNINVENAMPPQPKLEGQGALNLGSHPSAMGMPCAGLPYKLFKGDALVEQGKFDDEGGLVFKHELEEAATYQLELPNGQRYVLEPDELDEQHKINAGIGFHGYENAVGALGEARPGLERDRILANPITRSQTEGDS
jgi:type VI secretion system secreted protein VgrG